MENGPSPTDTRNSTESEGPSGQRDGTKSSQATANHGGATQQTLWQSTIWKNDNGTWKAVYHQVTPSMETKSSAIRKS
jgi:hypothetical protein